MNSGRDGTHSSIDKLGVYLRNELSAVEVYELALKNVKELGLPERLDECRLSHLERVEILRQHILDLGGVPSDEPGAWGIIAQAVEKDIRQVGIAALEEFEYQDLRRYRDELSKLDEEARVLMRTHVLPAQERTYRTIKQIRHGLA